MIPTKNVVVLIRLTLFLLYSSDLCVLRPTESSGEIVRAISYSFSLSRSPDFGIYTKTIGAGEEF